MKKIIFLLLLAQTISCLYACPNCIKYEGWRWGSKGTISAQCDCKCINKDKWGVCLECGHKVLPIDMKLTALQVKTQEKMLPTPTQEG